MVVERELFISSKKTFSFIFALTYAFFNCKLAKICPSLEQ